MKKLITSLPFLIILFYVTNTQAQTISDDLVFESLDTSQIRQILSAPVNFSETSVDTLTKKLQRIYSRADLLHYWWGRMKASSLMGFAYEVNGNSELSLMCFKRAISIANEKKEFNPFIPDIYLTLANIYQTREDYLRTSELLDKCEQYVDFFKTDYADADYSSQVFNINTKRAQAYTGQNEISKAEKALLSAHRAVAKSGLKPDQVMKINMARFYIDDKLQRYKECEKLVLDNMAISQRLEGHNRGRFNFAPILAGIYVKMGAYDKAYSYADSAKNAKLYDSYIQWQLHLHKKMVKADSATGNVKKLIDRYKKIQSLNDTINKRNRFSSIAYYQTELDIQTYINSLKQKEIELKSKSVIIVMALALVLFLLAIVFLIWRNFRKTKQNAHKLTVLNEQIRSKHTDMMIAYTSLEKSHENNKQLMKVVAHDLRNPLVSNMLFLENIEEQMVRNSETSRAINTIKINTSNSLNLINEMLHEKGEVEETNIEMVELHAVLQYCVNLLTEKAAEKAQTIKLQTEPVSLLIDREKIWRVMSNLIYNAVKFSPFGSEIDIQLVRRKNKVRTIIRDNGIGIPDSYKQDIFEMFSSSQRQGTNGEESFGMGLAISKSIVESHHGEIWFESTEGVGTTFYVELPLDNVAVAV